MNKSRLLAYLQLQQSWIVKAYETLNNKDYNSEMKLGLLNNDLFFIKLGNELLMKEVGTDE